ncbi:uncharacterized protein LOC131927883 [Physella acuta]|uniref:uncharacterized protein LOC131927883 n=1 Tax=Physella acuta TaxID=109671 RepID=UPI0027DDB5AE|nr:uncharacterized protein LOC131927883 [Physella acuta]
MNGLKALIFISVVACAVSAPSSSYDTLETNHGPYPSDFSCIDFTDDYACAGIHDGDYPLCTFCQYGYYATCSNQILHIRPCPDAYYQGNAFVSKMVFNSKTRDCQKFAPNCPRY